MDKREPLKEMMKYISKCPVCGTGYGKRQLQFFAGKDNANLAHISCAKCDSNFITMIMFFDTGVSSVGIVSDLTFQDAQRLHVSEKINIDDLIDGHKLIFEQSEKFLEYLIK